MNQVNKGQRSHTHLSKASFSQNLDEHKVVQVHLFGLWSTGTFNLSVLPASFSFHFNAASIISSAWSSMAVPRYRSNRWGRRKGVCFVLLYAVVERQSFLDVLQLLRICTEKRLNQSWYVWFHKDNLSATVWTSTTLVTWGGGGRLWAIIFCLRRPWYRLLGVLTLRKLSSSKHISSSSSSSSSLLLPAIVNNPTNSSKLGFYGQDKKYFIKIKAYDIESGDVRPLQLTSKD